MPFGGPPLPAATIAVIRQWITDGAAPTPPVAVAPFAVVASAPAMHDILFAPVSRLVVGFNRELDQTRLDASSVELERVGTAGAEVVPMRLHVAKGAPGMALRTLAHHIDGHYRVLVRSPPATGVASIGGERLTTGTDARVVTEFDVVDLP